MTETSDEHLRRHFRTRSVSGLLELWDEVMGDGERRLLLAELEARGHRTASLEWPGPGASGGLFPAVPGPTREDFRAMDETERMALPGAVWWSLRRRAFHRGLALAGVAAFVAFCVVVEARPELDDVEITIFGMACSGVAHLVYMGLASLCYGLGPALDALVPVVRRDVYRRWAYRAGFGLLSLIHI